MATIRRWTFPIFPLILATAVAQSAPGRPPELQAIWNGKDLTGWHGQRHCDPDALSALPAAELANMRAEDDATVAQHWRVQDGELVNDGEGAYLTTDAEFGDAEYQLDYKTVALADSGIYLRGTPQVQIWDFTEAGGKWKIGADKGSGGLWNNKRNPRDPLVLADRPFGEWNSLRIRQVGELTWVWLNEKLVVDGTVMENFWDAARPLRPRGRLQLQTHGGEIRFRNLRARAIPPAEATAQLRVRRGDGFEAIFDGKTLDGWQGDRDGYEVADGTLRCRTGSGGNLFTTASYTDFVVQLEIRLPPGGNNGLAIRYPGQGDAAYEAIEVQVLDDGAAQHAALEPWQVHGSLYGLVPAHRGYLRPQGEWNFEEVEVRGSRIRVLLNGTVIVAADVASITSPPSGKAHPGKDRKDGHFGFCGHGDPVEFRGIEIRRL